MRDAAVQADVPGQQVGIETGLRHRTGQYAVDLIRLNGGTRQNLAADLDTQIDGRDRCQSTAQIHPGRAHRIDDGHVTECRILPAATHALGSARSLSGS